MKQKFNVTGMTCSACSAHVEKAVNKLEGVRRAEVSLMTNSMNVEYDEAALAPETAPPCPPRLGSRPGEPLRGRRPRWKRSSPL